MYFAYTDASFKDGNIIVSYYVQTHLGERVICESYSINDTSYLRTIEGIEAVAIIELLKKISKEGLANVRVHTDDQTLIRLLNDESSSKNEYINSLVSQINLLISEIKELEFVWIPRESNIIADQLCRRTMRKLGYIDSKETPRVQEIVKEYAMFLIHANRTELTKIEKVELIKKSHKASNIETIKLRIDKHRDLRMQNNEKIEYHDFEEVILKMFSYVIEEIKEYSLIKKINLRSFLDGIHKL